MTSLIFESDNELPSSEEIADFEMKIDFKLPSEYKSFLLSTNGGEPENKDDLRCEANWTNQGSSEQIESVGIDYLFSLGIEENENIGMGLLYNYETFTLEQRVPRGTIPIALDGVGNRYLLSLNQQDFGAIYYWYASFEVDNAPSLGNTNVAAIAKSFDVFLNSFKI